mgnify:CR=1 FL=1
MEQFIGLMLAVMTFVLGMAILSYHSVQRAGQPLSDQVVVQDIRQQLRR